MTQQFTIVTVDSKNTGRLSWKLIITGTLLILLTAYWLDTIYLTILTIPMVILVSYYAINQSLDQVSVQLSENTLMINGDTYPYSSIERLNFDDDAVFTYLLRIHFKDNTFQEIHLYTSKKNLTEFKTFYELLKGKVNQ
jgi:hypothetical protein